MSEKERNQQEGDELSANQAESEYDALFNLFVQFAIMSYTNSKLEEMLESKNVTKKWNTKLTKSIKRHLERLNA